MTSTDSDHLHNQQTTEDKVVLFADILGFAALTESHPLDLANLRARDHFLSSLDKLIGAPKNPLSDVFFSFHYALKNTLAMASMHHSLTAIAFSDSAFIATPSLHEAVNIASDLIRSLIASKTPVRIGIAYGSFAALRFKSDITFDGGEHATQFLGTAVVRATTAEKCGIKGFRILLHPSVMPLLADHNHNPLGVKPPIGTETVDDFVGALFTSAKAKNPIRILKCPEKELANKAGVQYEIDYWDLPTTREASAWRGLQDMWDKAPQPEHNHYLATAEAIDRMRRSRGQQALQKLRRRTLPTRRVATP